MAVIGLTQTVSHELKMSHEVCIDFDKKNCAMATTPPANGCHRID